jgi:phosphate transport system substrate-binding protein
MDFTTTLTVFGTILGIVLALGGILNFVLNHNVDHPNRARNQIMSTVITVGTLLTILVVQYVVAPSTSLFTLPPNAPFPGSTLKACHVTLNDLPNGTTPPVQRRTYTGVVLRIDGSSVLYNLFTDAAKQFDFDNAETSGATDTIVQKLDSGQGLSDVIDGISQIGLSDIFIRDDPDPTLQGGNALIDYQVAVAPFTLVVSADLQDVVQNLTTQQISDIFSGRVTNWRSIGGPNEPITVFNRKLGSGTRVIFEQYVLGTSISADDLRAPTTTALINAMEKTQGAIGYAATTSIRGSKYVGKIAPVCIDGYGATVANINAGKYLFWSYEHAYVKTPTPLVKNFLSLVCSPTFQQQNVIGEGFLQVKQLSSTALATHDQDYPQSQPCGS